MDIREWRQGGLGHVRSCRPYNAGSRRVVITSLLWVMGRRLPSSSTVVCSLRRSQAEGAHVAALADRYLKVGSR